MRYSEDGRTYFQVVAESMGSFLNPPGHAEHRFSLRESARNGRERGSSSLTYAVKSEYTPKPIKDEIAKLLNEFPGQYTPEWEKEVYAYFAHCYSPDGVNREVSKCVTVDGPTTKPESHLGYLHIKSFFPAAQPNLELIKNPPAWGVPKTPVAESK